MTIKSSIKIYSYHFFDISLKMFIQVAKQPVNGSQPHSYRKVTVISLMIFKARLRLKDQL